FGLVTGRGRDKFAGLEPASGATGAPLLEGAIGWMDCRVEGRLDGGDRLFYLGEVVQSKVCHFAPPLTLQQLMNRAPLTRGSELMRLRHQESVIDADALRAFRQRDHEPHG